MYLMIRNPGVADAEAFTLLGVSTTRGSNRLGTVGQFGSGSKNAVALFLRNNIPVVICPANLKMEFYSKPKYVGGKQFDQVCVRYSGKDLQEKSCNKAADLGFTLQWGVQDWTVLSMAFREFVANAIDGAILAGGSYKDIEISVVEKPRAKSGYTSVFLPLVQGVQECWNSVGTLFLHLSHPEWLDRKLLPKVRENQTLVYKNGVLVCKLDEDSVFDYNLGNELVLDESRNAQYWDVRWSCAKAVRDASACDLAKILNAQLEGKKVFESSLDSTVLLDEYGTDEKKKCRSEELQAAFKLIAGENAVVCTGRNSITDFVSKKGFTPVVLDGTWFQVLDKYGVATENSVLSGMERDGREECEASEEMLDCVKCVWGLLEKYKLTGGKVMPLVKGFVSVMDGGSQTFGYYKMGGDTVYLHHSLGGKMLFKVALEEIVHYVTQSTDMSRDLQDYLFNLITEMSLLGQNGG